MITIARRLPQVIVIHLFPARVLGLWTRRLIVLNPR